jgi:hypothetical protein
MFLRLLYINILIYFKLFDIINKIKLNIRGSVLKYIVIFNKNHYIENIVFK